jgi:hypothetical protein
VCLTAKIGGCKLFLRRVPHEYSPHPESFAVSIFTEG